MTAGLSPTRRFLKALHPEGIPWIGTPIYNALTATTLFQRHYEMMARDVLGYQSEGRLLDIGTGPGWLLVSLHRQAPGMRLTGIDASPSMVARARSNVSGSGLADLIEIREGNAAHLPFEDGSFDGVVSTGSIHHWKEPAAGLNEVHRVLRAGGYALMYDIVSDTPASVLKETAREFGRLKILLFWLHSYEEPFYSQRAYGRLAGSTLFAQGQTRFVGLMCCLILRKQEQK